MKRESQDKWFWMLEEIDEMGEHLDTWEVNFVGSLIELRASYPGFSLTKPQMVKLENIHSRRVL